MTNNSGFWTDKTVMITGASSGIGKGLALDIAARGARLGLLARRQGLLDEIVADVKGRAVAVTADVRDAQAMKAAADRVREQLGPIDMLIANAGIGTSAHVAQLDPDHMANVIGINVLGAANSVAAVVPQMVERGQGQLVAISSLAAYRGLPKSAAYCASKAALSAYFESVRIDLRGTGVGVTIIHPGFIKTALTAGRDAKMPYLMELDEAIPKIVSAIEKGKKSIAFPWQLATVVRAGLLMPTFMYDWIAARNSFRE
ncbi:MAG TPA: SDR family NAD(P)-dependent oxidoreductase [Pyrinomonadaceae bacterium]|nr:SDR family NAD(P)-dependent oxidoreductase [Pyrinomonadaceae bacterium]